ncbi:hypothetical protein RB653_004600 [Dictyostelium firmibasis]|uniref:PH domain-containing protein n=1 Tax=Dictyostelium firmibasis TaxID=79012 RepID=A0AAN7Z3G6_9MYCE
MEIGIFDILYENEDGSFQQWIKKHITLNETNFTVRNNEFDTIDDTNNFSTANIIIVDNNDGNTIEPGGEVEMKSKQILLKLKTNHYSNSKIIILIPSQEIFDRWVKIINCSKNNVNNNNNNNKNINNSNINKNKTRGSRKYNCCFKIFFGISIFYALVWVGIFVALWFTLVTKNNFIGIHTKCRVNSVTKQNSYQKADEAGATFYYYDVSYNVTYALVNSTTVMNSAVVLYEKGCCQYSVSSIPYDCFYDEDEPNIVVFDQVESIGKDIKSIFTTFGTLALPLIVLFLITVNYHDKWKKSKSSAQTPPI